MVCRYAEADAIAHDTPSTDNTTMAHVYFFHSFTNSSALLVIQRSFVVRVFTCLSLDAAKREALPFVI